MRVGLFLSHLTLVDHQRLLVSLCKFGTLNQLCSLSQCLRESYVRTLFQLGESSDSGR